MLCFFFQIYNYFIIKISSSFFLFHFSQIISLIIHSLKNHYIHIYIYLFFFILIWFFGMMLLSLIFTYQYFLHLNIIKNAFMIFNIYILLFNINHFTWIFSHFFCIFFCILFAFFLLFYISMFYLFYSLHMIIKSTKIIIIIWHIDNIFVIYIWLFFCLILPLFIYKWIFTLLITSCHIIFIIVYI